MSTSDRTDTEHLNLDAMLREYMEATDRLQQTHEVLQREVVRLREELASKDRELEMRRRLAALGEIAAGVAHEVRNPLGAIQLYSGLLRRACREQSTEPALELLDKIEAGIQAIDVVVSDTLALAPRDRHFHPCRLVDVVQRACDASQKAVSGAQVRLDVELHDERTRVLAEEHGLQRVLVNLLVNAAEVSPSDGTVTLYTAAEHDHAVMVCVRDEGPGLPEEVLHRVFDPFFTTKEHGTGLGLTIAHRLIESYGGELHARNRTEGGAEFQIRLPVAEAGAPHESEPSVA